MLQFFIKFSPFSLEFQIFFLITRTFFFTVGQNNFGSKIQLQFLLLQHNKKTLVRKIDSLSVIVTAATVDFRWARQPSIPSLPHSSFQNSDKTAVLAVLPLMASLQSTGWPSVPGKPAGSNITGHSCPNLTNSQGIQQCSAVQCMTSRSFYFAKFR